jgi:uncharacterized membrane protein YqgA involved in biofilm formation
MSAPVLAKHEEITMTGTIVNSGAIIAGSMIGVAGGKYLSGRIRSIIMNALGLSVIVVGLQMALTGENLIAAIGCVVLGAITGELLKIETRIERLGELLKRKFRSDSSTFVEGFVTASVLYLTGVLVIIGPIQDGTVGDASTLYIKALLDGFASMAFASTLGIGVTFSALPVFIIQGAITLLASSLLFLKEPHVLNALTVTGGILIFGIGVNIMKIKKIPIGNFIPAIIYAIIWAMML